MPFTKQSVLNLIKLPLDAAERKREDDIELAFLSCLDDLSNRMQSINQVRKQETTIDAGTRETTLTGSKSDLEKIWYIKYGTGDDQDLLEYIAPEEFLKKYDNPDADADTPTYYTILRTVNGYPEIKFDVPTEQSDTLILYYYADQSKEANVIFQSGVAMAQGALAYFYGLDSPQGQVYYANYEKLVALRRASDDFKHYANRKFVQCQDDQDIMDMIKDYNNARY